MRTKDIIFPIKIDNRYPRMLPLPSAYLRAMIHERSLLSDPSEAQRRDSGKISSNLKIARQAEIPDVP